MGFRETLSGTGFVILNIIRGFNVICLLLSMCASIVMVVKTIMVSDFYLFDGATHVLTFFYAAFLVLTELDLFKNYFAANWPLLSLQHGFVTLGLLMITIAMTILGNLNKEATSESKLGSAFYGLVEAAGVLTLIAGLTNIVANYVFRRRKLGISARMIRAHGKQAARKTADFAPVPPQVLSTPIADAFTHTRDVDVESAAAAAAAASQPARGPSIRQVSDTNNPYAQAAAMAEHYSEKYTPSSVYSSPSVRSARTAVGDVSAPVVHDGNQFARFNNAHDIQRPATALHPAYRGNVF